MPEKDDVLDAVRDMAFDQFKMGKYEDRLPNGYGIVIDRKSNPNKLHLRIVDDGKVRDFAITVVDLTESFRD